MQCNAMHVKGQYSDWAEFEKEGLSSIEDDGGRSAPPRPQGLIGLNGYVWICRICSLYFSPFAKQNQAQV